jgi:uncharacterized protein YdeI (YjbR/CyaY-like superfamily)
MPEAYQGLLKASTAAWEFFEKQAGSYRKAAIWWNTSAKKEETRRTGVALAFWNERLRTAVN